MGIDTEIKKSIRMLEHSDISVEPAKTGFVFRNPPRKGDGISVE